MKAYSRSLAAADDEEGLEGLHPLPLAVKESDPLYKARIRKRLLETEEICEGTIRDIHVRLASMGRFYLV